MYQLILITCFGSNGAIYSWTFSEPSVFEKSFCLDISNRYHQHINLKNHSHLQKLKNGRGCLTGYLVQGDQAVTDGGGGCAEFSYHILRICFLLKSPFLHESMACRQQLMIKLLLFLNLPSLCCMYCRSKSLDTIGFL